jgi:hypothetical protein
MAQKCMSTFFESSEVKSDLGHMRGPRVKRMLRTPKIPRMVRTSRMLKALRMQRMPKGAILSSLTTGFSPFVRSLTGHKTILTKQNLRCCSYSLHLARQQFRNEQDSLLSRLKHPWHKSACQPFLNHQRSKLTWATSNILNPGKF